MTSGTSLAVRPIQLFQLFWRLSSLTEKNHQDRTESSTASIEQNRQDKTAPPE